MTKLHSLTDVQLRECVEPGKQRVLIRVILMLTAVCLMSDPVSARDDDDDDGGGGRGGFCSQTANLLFHACGLEAQDDFFKTQAICLNVAVNTERAQCLADASAARNEKRQLCDAQQTGRFDACKSLGEGRYDPDFDPALFDDPKNPTHPNPYFPMTVGTRWAYRGGYEVN